MSAFGSIKQGLQEAIAHAKGGKRSQFAEIAEGFDALKCAPPGATRSQAYAAIHATMRALHDVGAIDDQAMREFDATCPQH